MTSTTLLLGGRIYTPATQEATAMAVTDGVITWIGLDEPGRAIHPDAAIVDLDGHFVTPAFVDAHVHATASGLLLDGLDLRGCGSLADCLDLVADQVARATGHAGLGPRLGRDQLAGAPPTDPRRTRRGLRRVPGLPLPHRRALRAGLLRAGRPRAGRRDTSPAGPSRAR